MTSLAGPHLALLCAIVACAYVVEGLAGFFGSALVGYALYQRQWTAGTTRGVLLLLPMVPLGGWVGHRLHHAVPERTFRAAVNGVLLLAGVALWA